MSAYFRVVKDGAVILGVELGREFSFELGTGWAMRVLEAASAEDLEFLHDECVVTFANGWD